MTVAGVRSSFDAPQSVMAAQAAIHASIHARHTTDSAPALKRVVGSRLRGNDVERTASAHHHPTDPSSEMPISFCVSAMNSIGSFCSTSRTKPLTTRATASSSLNPRWRQ
jgi:hypothetical protein